MRRLQASEQELTMIKVAQAMDTIAMHACPTCLDEDFGFGLTASTDWEVRQLKPVPPQRRSRSSSSPGPGP